MTPTPTSRPNGINSKEGISLEKYIDAQYSALSERITLLGDSIEKASNLQRQTLEARLSLLNEYKQMADARDQTFITKVQFSEVIARLEVCIDNLEKNVDSLQITRALVEGKASQSQVMIVTAISIVGLLIGLAGIAIGMLK